MSELQTLRQDARNELGNANLLNQFDEAERLADRGDFEAFGDQLDDLAERLDEEGLQFLSEDLEGLEDELRF